jgi:predicted O-methyltransferase YrrM
MTKKIFSIPLNPKLTPEQFFEFHHFVERNKEYIVDIYFTSRIAPFKQDAMGDVFILEEDHSAIIENALNMQKHLGIPLSATFNNTQVPPTQKNLDTFIVNFKKLYDAGVRSATIPHTHWLATGQIQKAFPELYIKNTILRDTRTAVEVVNLAKAGFDYINLDRDLMRDRDTLLRLKEAKEWVKKNLGKDIKFSLLANEGCLGACPMMVEHFEWNNTRTDEKISYFADPISRVSCPKWEVQDPAVYLKTANFPPWREDWEEFINDLGIDVIKMHGRESYDRLKETMMIVDRWRTGEEILHDNFKQYLEETNLEGKPIDVWRKKIKNCKFDCWECQYCDKIEEAKNELKYSDLVTFVADCVAESGIPKINNKIPGLTSSRVQTLINSIAKGVGTYMEIGCYLGATAAAAMQDNTITGYFIDTWNEDVSPADPNVARTPPNNRDEFVRNIRPYEGNSVLIGFEGDMLRVNLEQIDKTIQFMFYDGPHDEASVSNVIQYYYPVLAEECVMIFDDANWDSVIIGANDGFEKAGLQVVYKKIILNSAESSREWWNGLYVTVVRK